MLGILLVNFLCTDSMRGMSFERLGDQTGLLNSNIERTYTLKTEC